MKLRTKLEIQHKTVQNITKSSSKLAGRKQILCELPSVSCPLRSKSLVLRLNLEPTLKQTSEWNCALNSQWELVLPCRKTARRCLIVDPPWTRPSYATEKACSKHETTKRNKPPRFGGGGYVCQHFAQGGRLSAFSLKFSQKAGTHHFVPIIQ